VWKTSIALPEFKTLIRINWREPTGQFSRRVKVGVISNGSAFSVYQRWH
jgi:hypothetical protein